MYTANTSMEDSCLANADGEMLIVPQQGKCGSNAGSTKGSSSSITGCNVRSNLELGSASFCDVSAAWPMLMGTC
jgi:hypothetical protein